MEDRAPTAVTRRELCKRFLLFCFPESFKACFKALCQSYETATSSMNDREIVKRTAHLLPGLFLARVDGKSPAEYITEDNDKAHVRAVAREFLTNPCDHPIDMNDAWHAHLNKN